MPRIITLSRPLNLPSFDLAEGPPEFLTVKATADIPEGVEVHCVTAIDQMRAADVAALPKSVKLIASYGVGVNHIDLNAAQERGILVSNTPVVTEDTADLAFGLILAACRGIGEGERFVRAGNWSGTNTAPLGSRVHGKTLGLVGFGAIGQAVARRAHGFGMPVIYWGRRPNRDASLVNDERFVADLGQMLSEADIVSIHVPHTLQTLNLIDASRMAQMRAGAVLINTARGGIVDEEALCAALENGRLAGAGFDVFDGEPEVSGRLLSQKNVVLTPHIGSATAECRLDMALRMLENVRQFLENGSVLDPVLA